MDFKDLEIFKGKTVADLSEEIYRNSVDKRNQIDIITSELRALVSGINEAVTIVPLIKDQLDVGVKNDEQLLKLMAIIQRWTSKSESSSESGNGFLLSEEEKQLLLKEIEDANKEDSKISKKIKEGEKTCVAGRNHEEAWMQITN